MIFSSERLNAQITFINEAFGIKFYPQKCVDTITITHIKNYPGYKMRLFLQNCNGETNFELFDKKGILKIQGQFTGSKDTLVKYSFTKTRGFTNGKNHTGIRLLKYLYLFESGTWLYFDYKRNVIKKEEYDYTFY